MRYVVLGFALLAGLYGLHRIALWAERRGWIHYRAGRGSSGTLGDAMLEVHSMLEPSKRYVLEERTKDDAETSDAGDPPEPGPGAAWESVRPYFLRTARLGFGTWSPDDLSIAMELWGDTRVTRLIGGPFTESQVRERLAREIATQASSGVQYWPLFRLADDAHVGCCGLQPYREDGVLELGVHLRPEHWGQGYATESALAAIAHAFGALGVRRLFAGHHPQNDGSRRLLERLGFRYVEDELYAPTGLEHPSYWLDRDSFHGVGRIGSQDPETHPAGTG